MGWGRVWRGRPAATHANDFANGCGLPPDLQPHTPWAWPSVPAQARFAKRESARFVPKMHPFGGPPALSAAQGGASPDDQLEGPIEAPPDGARSGPDRPESSRWCRLAIPVLVCQNEGHLAARAVDRDSTPASVRARIRPAPARQPETGAGSWLSSTGITIRQERGPAGTSPAPIWPDPADCAVYRSPCWYSRTRAGLAARGVDRTALGRRPVHESGRLCD